MALEEQLIELIGEFDPDKWYIIRPTKPLDPRSINVLKQVFQRHEPKGIGGILILTNELDIKWVETDTIRSTLRAFRINIDILRALYRQIKWRPLVRIRGALQKSESKLTLILITAMALVSIATFLGVLSGGVGLSLWAFLGGILIGLLYKGWALEYNK